MEMNPGALVAGRYRVDRKVGSGGMGEVWAGEHVAIGLRVALKTLLPAAACDRQIVARFKREAYLLGRIRSDHVAKVLDFVTDERFGLVLVMEFIEGEALGSLLEGRRLSIEETIDLGVDVASALCDLHRAQVVHRDLKPENIILEPLADGRKRAMIVDFGVGRTVAGQASASEEELTGITHADMAVGTIAYMAPEQLLSSRDVTSVSDIYALGAILYRAASGQPIFGGGEDADYAKKKLFTEADPVPLGRFDRVARGLQEIVGHALKRRPPERFASARQMLDELLELRSLVQVTALDLDAATEMAPLSSHLDLRGMPSLSGSTAPPPPAPRIEMPARDLSEEATTLDAMAALRPSLPSIDLDAPLPPPPPARPPQISSPDAPPSSLRSPQLSPPDAPPASMRQPPHPYPDEPTMPRSVALTAVAAALAGGLLLGFLAHLALSRPPPTSPPALPAPGLAASAP
jgi:serine/threonine-protein kinase